MVLECDRYVGFEAVVIASGGLIVETAIYSQVCSDKCDVNTQRISQMAMVLNLVQ